RQDHEPAVPRRAAHARHVADHEDRAPAGAHELPEAVRRLRRPRPRRRSREPPRPSERVVKRVVKEGSQRERAFERDAKQRKPTPGELAEAAARRERARKVAGSGGSNAEPPRNTNVVASPGVVVHSQTLPARSKIPSRAPAGNEPAGQVPEGREGHAGSS